MGFVPQPILCTQF